ncbi:MAG: GntR family transcriptional regulator [Actinobacteria bacterium]|nr:GntR family transcriptional regulator [Actinomycetota bacterium]
MTLGSASSLVPPRTRAQWVDDRLRDEILVGRIAPGERVPVERLATTWGVSPTPIRESLRRLAGEGLITLLPQRGARVAHIDASLATDIYSVRLVLEPMALRQSMLRAATTDDARREFVADVTTARDALLGHHDSAEAFYVDHRRFHRALLSRCANQVLIGQVEQLTDRARLFQLLGAAPVRRSDHRREHADIADAVMNGDVDGAVDALTAHLMLTLEVVGRLAEESKKSNTNKEK